MIGSSGQTLDLPVIVRLPRLDPRMHRKRSRWRRWSRRISSRELLLAAAMPLATLLGFLGWQLRLETNDGLRTPLLSIERPHPDSMALPVERRLAIHRKRQNDTFVDTRVQERWHLPDLPPDPPGNQPVGGVPVIPVSRSRSVGTTSEVPQAP